MPYLKRYSKKILLLILLLAVLIAIYLFINRGPIYALTPQTAVFITAQSVPETLPSLRAKDCGVCHQVIYQEWQGSMHAKAYSNAFFQAYHKKDKYEPSCLVCHTPLENQLEKTISYRNQNYYRPIAKENPAFDPVLQSEGVTCAVCHVRDGVVLGPYSREQLDSPHPVKYDPKFKNKDLCLQCHQVPSKPFSLMRTGVCSTGEEFIGNLWDQKGYQCQHCHMDRVQRSLVAGYPERETRMHNWPGGYSGEQLEKAFSFQAIRRQDSLWITITNSGAGHKVPTGDPDRYIDLDFSWQSVATVAVEVGEGVKIKSIRFKRQLIWQPIIFELSDNRLAAGESLEFEVPLNSTEPNSAELWVQGTYHIMTDWSYNRLENNFGLSDAPDIHRPFLNRKIIIETDGSIQ